MSGAFRFSECYRDDFGLISTTDDTDDTDRIKIMNPELKHGDLSGQIIGAAMEGMTRIDFNHG